MFPIQNYEKTVRHLLTDQHKKINETVVLAFGIFSEKVLGHQITSLKGHFPPKVGVKVDKLNNSVSMKRFIICIKSKSYQIDTLFQ